MGTCHSSGKYFTAVLTGLLAASSVFAEAPMRNATNSQPVEKMALRAFADAVVCDWEDGGRHKSYSLAGERTYHDSL